MKAKIATKAMRRDAAATRLENAVAELIEASENMASATSTWDKRARRADLLHCARVYSRAVDALSRIG